MAEMKAVQTTGRFRARSRLQDNGLVMLLACLVLVVFMLSLPGVRGINAAQLTRAALLGALCGVLLAFSRFSGRQAALYNLAVSLPVSLQISAVILPPIEMARIASFSEWLHFAHWRLAIFLQQAAVWLLPGTENRGGGLVEGVLLAWGAWQVSAWLFWRLLRAGDGLSALAPIGVFLCISLARHPQPAGFLVTFLFVSILLAAAASFRRQHRDWDQRTQSYPQEMGEWPASALVLAALIALLARFAITAGTAQGRQDLLDLFRRPAAAPDSSKGTGTVDNLLLPQPKLWIGVSDLTELDTPPVPTDTTVMWVRVGGAPEPPYYLRARLFEQYTGRGWQSSIPLDHPDPGVSKPIEECSGALLEQQVQLLALHGNTLFAVGEPISAGSGAELVFSPGDNSTLVRGAIDRYRVTSCSGLPALEQLRRSGGTLPLAIRQTYLQLPTELPDRVGELASRVTEMSANPFDAALRIQAYLREMYGYSLDTATAPPKQDLVDHFLFESRQGYCSHFASAMVVMLRTQGIPARLVSGFLVSDYQPEHDAYRVPASAAHAWVEVYFPGVGWVVFEPTPTRAPVTYAGQVLDNTQATSKSAAAGLPARAGRVLRYAGLAAAGLVLLSLLGGAVLAQRAWQDSAGSAGLYAQVRRALALCGFFAPGSVTPHEFLAFVGSSGLAASHPLLEALRAATENFALSSFSRHPVEPARLAFARAQWRKALLPCLRLGAAAFLLRLWKRLRFRNTPDSPDAQAGRIANHAARKIRTD